MWHSRGHGVVWRSGSVRLGTNMSRVRVLTCHRSCAPGKGTLHDFPHFAQMKMSIVLSTVLVPGCGREGHYPSDGNVHCAEDLLTCLRREVCVHGVDFFIPNAGHKKRKQTGRDG
ncbi:hypothetical protein Bbelb_021490 [Branchiostoma belcheri]|nr:hypothetical protein Bbelb_021490 [Branchiostoma belcheri]